MAPGGPLPLAPLGHPAGLPLRRCACSGQKAVCAAHSGPSARPAALGPWLRCSLRRRPRPGLAPGSAGRSPSGSPPAPWLRLSGRAAPAVRGQSGPPSPSLRAVLRAVPARARSPGPWVRLVALRGSAGSLVVALGPLRAPWLPGGRSLRRGPPAAPGCARLRFACPPGSRRGPWRPFGPLSSAPRPPAFLGFEVFRRCGGGRGGHRPPGRAYSCVCSRIKRGVLVCPGPFRA